MAHIMIRHKVKDFSTWKPFFDKNGAMRGKAGCKGGYIFHSEDNPNDVVVIFDWDNIDNAKKFAQSSQLRDAMQKAGVQGTPEVYFLDSEGRFSQ